MPQPNRSQLIVYGTLALLALALGGRWLAAGGSGEQPSSSSGSATPERQREDVVSTPAIEYRSSRSVVVHVAGKVRRPGVYRLHRGDRVEDAVRRAGGPSREGDVNAVNLAAPVQDGVQVVVPAKAAEAVGAGAPAPAGPSGTAASTAPVNLNTATAEQLDTLDGVGPATAAKILDYRREHGGFRNVDDLGQVPGIGPKKLAALRTKVVA